MLEHLFNCHGEWNAILAALGSAPLVGYWVRAKLHEHKEDADESR